MVLLYHNVSPTFPQNWVHYMTHDPEAHMLLFKQPLSIYVNQNQKDFCKVNKSSLFFSKNEGFALLDQDSDSEEYIEMNHHHNRTKSVNSDDYYLKETRTWTSVPDRQLQAGDANDEDTIKVNQDQIVKTSVKSIKYLYFSKKILVIFFKKKIVKWKRYKM